MLAEHMEEQIFLLMHPQNRTVSRLDVHLLCTVVQVVAQKHVQVYRWAEHVGLERKIGRHPVSLR